MGTLTLTITDKDASSANLVNELGSKDDFAGMARVTKALGGFASGTRRGSVRAVFGSTDRTFSNGPSGGSTAVLTMTVPESDAQLGGYLRAPATQVQQGINEISNYLSGVSAGMLNATVAVNVGSGSFTATYDEGSGAAAAAPSLAGVNGGPTLWYDPSGITEASGVVASWDSIGSNTLRFENADTAERPTLVTVGSRTIPQFDGSNDVLFSASAFTAVENYVVALLMRVDTYVNNRRIFDTGSTAGGYLAFFDDSGQKLRYEQGASDLVSTSSVANGEWHSVILDIRGDGETSTLYLQGASDGTLAGTALAPDAQTFALGAIASTGGNSGAITFADFALWNDVSSPAIADIYAYHQAVAAELGVSLG